MRSYSAILFFNRENQEYIFFVALTIKKILNILVDQISDLFLVALLKLYLITKANKVACTTVATLDLSARAYKV